MQHHGLTAEAELEDDTLHIFKYDLLKEVIVSESKTLWKKKKVTLKMKGQGCA